MSEFIKLDSTSRVGSETLRPLIFDDKAESLIRCVREFAERPENLYRPGMAPPGDKPDHTCRINTYRIVYSITEVPSGRYRHLSISVPSKKFPHPAAVGAIASAFGFTGWEWNVSKFPPEWLITIHDDAQAIVVAQELSSTNPSASKRYADKGS